MGAFDRNRMLDHNHIDACAAIRRKVWEQNQGYDGAMPVPGSEDWDLWLGTFSRGWKFAYVPEILFDYRVKEESMATRARREYQSTVEYIARKHALLYRQAWLDRERELFSLKIIWQRFVGLLAQRLRNKFRSPAKRGRDRWRDEPSDPHPSA